MKKICVLAILAGLTTPAMSEPIKVNWPDLKPNSGIVVLKKTLFISFQGGDKGETSIKILGGLNKVTFLHGKNFPKLACGYFIIKLKDLKGKVVDHKTKTNCMDIKPGKHSYN
jgi:hypothetical protein